MATVVFGGTTLWDDAATGIGGIQCGTELPWAIYQVEYLVRSGGKISKETAVDPGRIIIRVEYRLTAGELTTLRSNINARLRTVGQLAVTDQPALGNCLLAYPPQEERGPVNYFCGVNALRRRYTFTYVFERLGGL